ncbi:MAG: OmpA family protein [Planctomycetota bacterium]
MQTRSRITCTALAVVALLGTGCQNRTGEVEKEELRADNERLTAEITALSKENLTLAEQRNKAREENQRLRAHLKGMESQMRDLSDIGPNIPGLSVIGDGGVALDQDFAFKKGSADLNEQAVNSIRQLAQTINDPEYADTFVLIVGHTDTTPVVRAETKQRFGDNWGLSAMRAAAVVRALEDADVDPERLRGGFRGEHDPAASNATAEGKAANRRVEIYLQLPSAG